MPAPAEILQLVERFDRHRETYLSPRYNETQLRREFVDPFFKALGWDVDNAQGYAEAYKDVVHEDAIKIGGATKAPDYSFRIGGARKFFVETKKPSLKLKDDPSPAFQLRRYAWSAKLPLSILTDFEEFAVYNCRVRPDKNDKASRERTLYIRHEEYADRWDEIAGIFSREAILRGSFDKYAESKKKRGTAEVDAEFLNEIEGWRDALARNLALRNDLGQRELNFAVQRTIDRIIFLRICEDRGIEAPDRLRGLTNGPNIYKRLCQLFEQADDRYNSGLFHFHREKDRAEAPDELTLSLHIDDKVLRDIIGHLYYPESPYEFSVFPAEILGQVYEQFLGKVIVLTSGHRARVEDKPEVKKAGGVYYTPAYIVEYIVENTAGKLLEGKTPQEVGGLTDAWKPSKTRRPLAILDPACGSGSFLIGAYQKLLDWHRDWYTSNEPANWLARSNPPIYEGPRTDPDTPNYRLTTAERKRILLSNIYGVDIDPQAVEVTKLSLLLKVLEGETRESLQRQLFARERALPDLGRNIKCGNSLIGPDFYDTQQLELFDEEERLRINVFDWHAEFPEIMSSGGFDAVIGNPPYDVLEKDRGKSSWPHESLMEYVRTRDDYEPALGGKLNLFRFFITRSLALLRDGGRFGNIVPLALLADISCASTRRHLVGSAIDLFCDCFPQKDNPSRRVFLRAKLSTVVITCTVRRRVSEHDAHLAVRVYPWNDFADPHKAAQIRFEDTKLLDPQNTPVPLVDAVTWDLCRKVHRNPRVDRLGDLHAIEVRRGEINQTIYREFITDDPTGARLLKGVEVGRYRLHERLSQGKREWLEETSFLRKFEARPIVHTRRIATQRITGVDERLRIVATIVEPPTYFADSTNSVSVAADANYDLRYLLGLLNSRLFQWRFKVTSTNNNVGTNELESMPFRLIDFANEGERAVHSRMVRLVDQMLALKKEASSSRTAYAGTAIERQIAATDRQIDQLVYDLYGLTDEDIRIVERATAQPDETTAGHSTP